MKTINLTLSIWSIIFINVALLESPQSESSWAAQAWSEDFIALDLWKETPVCSLIWPGNLIPSVACSGNNFSLAVQENWDCFGSLRLRPQTNGPLRVLHWWMAARYQEIACLVAQMLVLQKKPESLLDSWPESRSLRLR